MKKLLIFAFLAGTFSVATAQDLEKRTILIDSVSLEASTAARAENNVGGRSSAINRGVLDVNRTQSLSELLSENSLVYMKSLGQGGLATSSFRGTSSNHTQVNWNGIPINSPMLGNFDFSQVPVLFTDEVTLYHGSSYLKGGAGALGGSINLNNQYNKKDKSSEFKILSEYGSNSTYTEAASARFSVGKFTSTTRLFFQKSKNDFKYLNKVLSKDAFYERRANADYQKAGVMQQLYYDLPHDATISANIWYQWDKRSLPPPIMVYRTSKEQQTSANLRSFVSYNCEGLTITASYLQDKLDYSRRFDIDLGGIETSNLSHSAIIKGDYQYILNQKLELNATANYRYDKVVSDNFSDSNTDRNTVNAQLAAIWQPVNRLFINGQVMGEVNAGRAVATYSVGASYEIVKKLLTIKASNAYNYRFPTLNDLYWNPGGNINLKPERGFSYDATVSLTPHIGAFNLRFDATYYNMDIHDWIMWIPTRNGYIWEPQNFSRVRSQGVEVMGEVNVKTGSVYHKIIANYAYTSSVDRSETSDATYNKQLPYVPLNRWNIRYTLAWRGLSADYCVSFTDVRYVTGDYSYSTNAYTTHDAEVGYKFTFGRRTNLKASLRVDNISNSYYESTQYYPMPLRSFYGSLMFVF